MRTTQPFLLLAVCVLLVGCDNGPQRYDVTGVVTFNGEPVPVGQLMFTPDNTKDNHGPQGVAQVKEGQIETLKDRRVVGGPHWVQILSFDGKPFQGAEGWQEEGRPLAPIVQAPVDLPMGDAEVAIDIVPGPEEATATVKLVE